MKNILNYYYSLHPEEISHEGDKYFFEYLGNKYVLEPFKRPLTDIDPIYKINRQMVSSNILVHEIIVNNENKILTYINNSAFVLMEIYVNPNARINLSEICYINNNSINVECDKILNRYDWITLWETKNDYFEAQINEIGKKYPNLCNYANYYIGLAENAISYMKSLESISDITVLGICHKRINSNGTLYDLYHPLNFIYDYRIRDVCEYIKSSFFNGQNTYDIVIEYFNNNYLSYKEALLFYARLLYPSYFFDMYDDIVNKELNENVIESIIIKSEEYENFLVNINIYLSRLYNRYIPQVDWLIKKSYI